MITINMNKAKNIGHVIRRQLRAAEFAPFDDLIVKQIPGTDVQAVEAQRQLVRDKYAAIQNEIDASTTPEQIKEALGI